MPQGLPKKIEIDLLLADLALQLRDPLLRSYQSVGLCQRSGRHDPVGRYRSRRRPTRPTHRQGFDLGHTPAATKRTRPTQPIAISPLIKTTPKDPKLTTQRANILARTHPLKRRKLELSTENSAVLLGHQFPLYQENCPPFPCLILGVHSKFAGKGQGPHATSLAFGIRTRRSPWSGGLILIDFEDKAL